MNRASAAVRNARRLCDAVFEPLWRPAPYLGWSDQWPPPDQRKAVQLLAKRQAFAWLSHKLGQQITSFDEIADLETLRAAYLHSVRATILTVRRDPLFASTPAGAIMLADQTERAAQFEADYGPTKRFREYRQARNREQREAQR